MEELERNFHGMKRKQLQALCKKHGILANKSNAEMAHLLTLTLKGIENPKEQGQGEVQNESDSMKVTKILKNVKFKPAVEIREYEPSVYKGRKRRRSMVHYGKVSSSPPGIRNTEQRTVERNVDEVVGKKRGRGREKKGSVGVENVDVSDNSRPPVITKEGGVQLVKGGDKSGRRRLRSREVVIEENVEGGEGDLVVSRKNSKREESRKRGNRDGIRLSDEVSEVNVSAKDDAKPANAPSGSRRNARKNESTSLLSVDFRKTESFGRTTRSRAKLRENTSITADKAETVEVQDEYEKVLQTEEILEGAGRYALGRKSFVPRKGLVVEILSEEGVESVKGGRRSRRNTSKKEGTSLSSGCFCKTEILGRTTRSRSKLEENTSSVTANKAETIEIQGENQKLLHLEEPLKDFGRYALRRKSTVPQKGIAVETVSKEGLESVNDATRSKRNMAKAKVSKPIVQVVTRRRTRFGAQATVESADEITEVNKEHNKAVQLEESLNAQDRNASRQKSFTAQKGQVESEGPDEKIETIKQSRNADLKFANKVEASGQFSSEIEKAPISIGHVRGSRSNTVVLSSAFATGELVIGEAVGMVGCLKRKRGPTLETDSSTVGECLAGKPSREVTQHASRGNLVGSTVPGKIVEKKQHDISAVPVMIEEALFTEETQIEDTGLTMPEATGDKPNFSLSCSKEVFKTSDKKGFESKTSEMRTNFSEVAAGCSSIQEGVDTKTNLQETPSPTSTSVMLCFANQETPENASQPIVLNEEANTVAGDTEKLTADAILEVRVDDASCRSKEGGADLGNDNLDEHGQTELQTNASDMFPLANRFSFAKQSDFSGLENGLERRELREDMSLESGDVNDFSTELVDRTSAVEAGFCDLENTGQKIRTNKNEHEEASCDDRPSPAAGGKMVSFITEINLQEDGDALPIQAAEENQNFISEESSSNVFQVSRRTCTHELLHGEGTCLSAAEKGIDEGENCSAATVPLQCKVTGIGKQRLSFYAGDSSEDRKRQHHDEKSTEKINSSCKDEKHVLEENEGAADALPQSSLQDKKEVTFTIKTDICAVETTGESEVTTHSDGGKASTGVNSSSMLFEKLGGYKEMNAMRNCSIDASIDVPVSKSHEAVMVMESGRNMDAGSDAEQSEFKEGKSGCAVETVHGDDNVCQKVSAEANASSLTWLISKEMEGFEGKTFDMMMDRPSDFLISNKELAGGKNMARYQCDQLVRKESVTGALLFELCDHSSSDEVAGNADATLTPTIEIFGGKKVGSWRNTSKSIEGINMWTGQETISVGSDSKADTFTQVMNDRFDEDKTAEVSGDLYDHISKYGEAADKESLNMTTKKLDMSGTQNEGTAQPHCPVGLGNLFSDYGCEFLKINDAGRNASPDIASADFEGIDETSNGVMGSELEHGGKAGKFDDLKEVNALELERSASVSLENRISMDVIAAFKVEKVEDDSKLYQSNIDDEKEFSIVSLPQVTPKSIGKHSVEEGLLHAIKDDCIAASNDASKNIKADRAGSVAVIGKICFEKTEGCTMWSERTPISPQIPKSSGKKAQQSPLEKKSIAESSGTCGMGSSTDAVSELNVLLSHGEKYKSHPGSKSIGNEAGVKVMASNDRVTEQVPLELLTGSDASALFTNREVNLIQGSGEEDLVEESDGEASKENLISNDSEHTAWINKNVEEVLFTNREVNLILGNGEQDQVEKSDGVASEDNLISNDPLDEHVAKTSISNDTLDDAPLDLKVDNIYYSEIQDTCEIGSSALDKVSSGAAANMDILEEVVIGGIPQTVIPAEASHETAESPLQERFLSCSKSEESLSPDTPCRLPEITSGASGVQRNGPESYKGEFVPQLYCKDMRSHGEEETTCAYRGSIPTEQGEFHKGDYEVLIAQNVGAEEVREALATDDSNLESNPSDPQEVAIEQANKHPDALNESLLMVGLDYPTQNLQSCGCSLRGDSKHALKERESHSIETEATNCLHQLDEGVFSEEIVGFGNGFVTSPFKRHRDVDSSAGTSISAFQHCITENDAWELSLFFEENEQDENQTSGARFLHTNLRNEGAGKVYENITVTEQAAIQVDEEQHGELLQVMDEQNEEKNHTYCSVSDEPSFEDVEGSKKQDCVLLEIDSIQERINCENHQNKSVNTEHSYDSKEKEILIDVNEVNGYHDDVSSEQMGERNSSYLKQYNNESLSVEDIGVIENLGLHVSSKPNRSTSDQSTEIINSTSSQDIAVREDQTHQLKLPSSQKGVSCDKEEETHSSDAKQLTTSVVRLEARKTGFVQATPLKMVTHTGMKENLASIKREKRGNMTAPNPLSKRRALGNLRNN
ncbi:PREDICTED: uncharacterized protein LOC105138486 isoform X3 [Populus euphratica]|uniref:Uncharacterized protein LOC105138486 isoform X3 n=1 Tax=Populus euphratica TaxID=75702 RepID=A0AAJ6V8F0_POPEU|nr:PREDICTED: uncharacterized protein LOC105138486 isoform X3 [Populus euphratica]